MTSLISSVCALLTVLFQVPASHAFELPTGLDSADRQEMLRILGAATSTKLVTNPYPLGGYPGLEVGVSIEVVNVEDLNSLGNATSSDQTELTYPRLSIGKGLYGDVDLFFSFVPYNEVINMSEYGGLLRWTFFDSKVLPISLASVVHYNSLNIEDSFITDNLGLELMGSVTVQAFSIYAGFGQIQSTGSFLSGSGADAIVDTNDPGVDATTNVARESITDQHVYFGASVRFESLFAAAQIDQYRDSVVSGKLGLRF